MLNVCIQLQYAEINLEQKVRVETYLERSQTLDKDASVAVLQVKCSWEVIEVPLDWTEQRARPAWETYVVKSGLVFVCLAMKNLLNITENSGRFYEWCIRAAFLKWWLEVQKKGHGEVLTGSLSFFFSLYKYVYS